MSIQLFTPKFRVDECLAAIRECLEKGWTGLGFKTVEFEKAWCEYANLPYAHFLNSNTVGLHLAFHVLKMQNDWNDGDEVITTPLTFVSTNHAIVYENLQPVFADVDDTLCLDPNSIRKKITSKTRAIIYVGFGGNTGRLDEVVKIAKEHNLKLILDAAHMSGTRYHGEHIGQQADVTIFSFQAVKNLPTADSGMICFRDEANDKLVRELTWLGINKDTYSRTSIQGHYKWRYEVDNVGFKYHGNSIMAAMGLVSLRYVDEDNEYRRQLASWYDDELKNVEGIKFIEKIPECVSAQHLYQIRLDNRDGLMEHLHHHDIYPGVHYRDNTDYKVYEYAAGQAPYAHQISSEVISLPLHLFLTQEDIIYISSVIKEFFIK